MLNLCKHRFAKTLMSCISHTLFGNSYLVIVNWLLVVWRPGGY